MSCTIYTVRYNFATHATYPLALTTYKYSELQVSFAIHAICLLAFTMYKYSDLQVCFVTHATCPLAFMMYKYSELQVFSTTQKLNCKANYKTPFFFIVFLGCSAYVVLICVIKN
jgi:hypothetical protein